jgi:DNA replication protein DnaC
MMQILNQQLSELKLSGIKAALAQQAEQPNLYAELSFNERLSLLLEHEINGRQQRRIERLIKQAKFRLKADLSQLDTRASRGLHAGQIRTLQQGDWLKHQQQLIITGATGCGKTFLACALGHHFCRQGISVRYFRLKTLLEQMYLAGADGSYRKFVSQLSNTQLLILDDWGLEPMNTQQRSDLLELIDARYDRQATLIASQLPIEHWYDIIGESTHADAILDRLVHRAIKIELQGESMRKITKSLTDADQAG